LSRRLMALCFLERFGMPADILVVTRRPLPTTVLIPNRPTV
jgi:hypothetical protein